MKKTLLLLLILHIQSFCFAYDNLNIVNPANFEHYQGYISNAEANITIEGHSARVELTFSFNIDTTFNNYGNLPTYSTGNLEAQLNFEMPKNSYFFDSYLWLNDNTIIRAKLLNKESATTTYDSIVNRRRDPSLLRKEYDNNYSLSVFPITTIFKRKVKIIYSVPLANMKNDNLKVLFPRFIFSQLKLNDHIKVRFNKSPDIEFFGFSNNLNEQKTNEMPQFVDFEIPKYTGNEPPFMVLKNYKNQPVSFYYEQINNDFGFYEIRILTDKLSGFSNKKSTNIYNIHVPLKNGFKFNPVNSTSNTIYRDSLYIEASQYYGKIDFSKSLEFNYIVDSIPYQILLTIDSTNYKGYIHQNFTSMYCNLNKNQYSEEYSLRSRILTDQTAFLALENGDTVTDVVKSYSYNYTGNIDFYASIKEPHSSSSSLSVYPNPFNEKLTVSSNQIIKSIKISNLLGQTVFYKEYKGRDKEVILHMKDINLTQQMYILTVESENGLKSIRILRENL